MSTESFDPFDTAGLPGLNKLKAAWDRPLRREDPLIDEERRLLAVAQLVRDSLPSTPLPHIISDNDMMEACLIEAAGVVYGFNFNSLKEILTNYRINLEMATIAVAFFNNRMTNRRDADLGRR